MKGQIPKREIKENDRKNHVEAIYRKHEAWWIESYRVLNLDRCICQGAIESCPQQSDLDGSRSYQASIEQTENFSMDREFVEKLSSQILKNFDGSRLR